MDTELRLVIQGPMRPQVQEILASRLPGDLRGHRLIIDHLLRSVADIDACLNPAKTIEAVLHHLTGLIDDYEMDRIMD